MAFNVSRDLSYATKLGYSLSDSVLGPFRFLALGGGSEGEARSAE